MPAKAILTTLFLIAAGPAAAECAYRNAYNHLTNEYVTVPVSCKGERSNPTPRYRTWHECPVLEERDARSGEVHSVRSCA